MNGFDRPGLETEEPIVVRRSPAARIADLGDRVARSFSVGERGGAGRSGSDDAADPLTTELDPIFDQVLPRFPIARQGYDCVAVDEYVSELEQELAELDGELATLRASAPSTSEAAGEIERLSQQTSGILLAAHDGAQQITRHAQEEADRCLADAATNALAITSEANQQVKNLQEEIASLERERKAILKDVRRAAAALTSLAGDAPESVLTEPVRAS